MQRRRIVHIGRLRSRRLVARGAVIVVLALLFQQVALAAYLCPVEQTPAAERMIMTDCEGMPPTATTPLCSRHCNPDTTTAPDARVAQVPPLLLPPMRFDLAGPVIRSSRIDAGVPIARSDPPPTLRFCSLQI